MDQKNTKNVCKEKNREPITRDQKIRKEIRIWIEQECFRDFLQYVKNRVMGQEEVSSVVTNVYSYLKRVSAPSRFRQLSDGLVPLGQVLCEADFEQLEQTRSNCNNMLLCAPSGCGKTETYRAIKDYFKQKIPSLIVSIADVSNITPAGFRGSDPTSIIEPFAKLGIDPVGIVFMDEFDKICIPTYTSDHSDLHLDVQHNLLTLVEGSIVETRFGFIDTHDLLFIGTGSFDEYRKSREINDRKGIGFYNDSMTEEKDVIKHYEPITRENMIVSGGCYELIGRFSYIVNYHPLDRDAILLIIEKIRKQIETDFECRLELGMDLKDRLCKEANSKFGCRLLDSLLRDTVLAAYGDALQSSFYGDILSITVTDLGCYTYEFLDYEPKERLDYDEKIEESEEESDQDPDVRQNFEELLLSLLDDRIRSNQGN